MNKWILIITLIVIIINSIFLLYSYFYWKNFTYTLVAGTYKILKDFVDKKPGKVVVSKGVLREDIEIIPMNNFSETKMTQSFLQKLFGAGNIILTNSAYLNFDGYSNPNQNEFIIRNISNPEKCIVRVQDMIDNARGQIEMDEL